MTADADFVAYVLELFAPAGRASARRMFGGHGITVDGAFCAIAFDGRLYLKADADTQAAFAAAGCAPFVYTGQKAPIEMSYWSVPEEALDSAEDMRPWLRRALEAAGRKVAKKAAGKRRPRQSWISPLPPGEG
jgi:DNA transformation protein and related proteins